MRRVRRGTGREPQIAPNQHQAGSHDDDALRESQANSIKTFPRIT